MDRNTLKTIALDTLATIKKGFFISPDKQKIDFKETQAHAETQTKVYSPKMSDALLKSVLPENEELIEKTMKRRIEKVLRIALENGNKTVVLGAWGCGVFGNDPKAIARYFKSVIEEKFLDQFTHIVFAIHSNNSKFIQPFQEAFAEYSG